ncbi:MAG: cation diffusion facilitator family transporter [bacterium]
MKNHEHHCHCHHRPNKKNYIFYAVAFTFIFGIVEALSGWWSGSLTLLSDAGHMWIDALALSLAALASWLVQRPTTAKHTYGLGRAEVIISWLNSIFLIILIIKILIEAINRLQTPHFVAGKTVMIVAIIGLVINILTAWVLHKGEKTLNTRAALLHVFSDLLGSVAVLVSGIVIYFTNWMQIDPILSIFVCILILISTIRLLRESLLVLMEGTPIHINTDKVKQIMQHVHGVDTMHDLHIWTLTSGTTLLTAHVVVTDPKYWPTIIDDLREVLQKNFGIVHVTLQVETSDRKPLCVDCENKL